MIADEFVSVQVVVPAGKTVKVNPSVTAFGAQLPNGVTPTAVAFDQTV